MKKLFLVFIITSLINGLLAQDQVQVGDKIQGGIVFHIDETGMGGLVAAPYDQTLKKVMWGANGNTYALSPNNGVKNTLYFVNQLNIFNI